jgi:hypothetical protein
MKKCRALILLTVTAGLAGCAGAPSFNIDNDIWAGTAVCPGNPETNLSLTFSQEGETVEGVLELNATTRTLIGTLKGTTLDMSAEAKDPAVFGMFSQNQNAKTFSGTLQFPNRATTIDCTLTMSYQGEL